MNKEIYHHDHCECGHSHHDHVNDDHCGCGHEHHDHEHEHHHHHEQKEIPAGSKKTIYILENLGCANCAAKMERKINELPEVEMAVITFATKQLAVAGKESSEKLLPKLQEICASVESEVIVKIRDEVEKKENRQQKASILEVHKKAIYTLIAGALLFVAGLITDVAVIFVAAYLLLGIDIIMTAMKNVMKGHVFDENFLMSIATIAAFAIGDYAEAVGIMLFYKVGQLFEEIAVSRSRSQIMEAVDMRPETVNYMHGDHVHEIPAAQAKAGDILLIRPGDRIPLDAKVVEGRSQIDTSPVTGEPVPVSVYPGKEVLSGCVNEQGVLKIEVLKPLSESMVTRILDSVENAAASKPKIDRFITKFARIYTPVIVLLALATAIIPSFITGEWNYWIYTAITFLVISCPCALVLSVPLAFFSGIGAGSKQGILFKGGVAIEALKNVKAVVMDKTGTITKGTFKVQEVKNYGRLTKKQILTIAADCELASTHPIGKSIVDAAKNENYSLVAPKDVEEISGKGIRAVFPMGTALCGSKDFLQENGIVIPEVERESYGTKVFLSLDGNLIGEVMIADEIKPESKDAISRMKQMNLVTAMFTGDAVTSAQEVAHMTGVEEVRAELLPQDKLTHLQDIRKKHGEVLFVGDGINDAPVLAGADVGAAMGSGADAAIEAADVVFMNSSLEAIPEAIAIAKKTQKIAMQNVVFALAVKFLVMILGFLGMANMWMAVFADTGVAILCVLNSIRALRR